MTPVGDHNVSHEAAVDAAIDDELARKSAVGPIADLTVPAGASYVQAEATATRTAINNILTALRDEGIIPAA